MNLASTGTTFSIMLVLNLLASERGICLVLKMLNSPRLICSIIVSHLYDTTQLYWINE